MGLYGKIIRGGLKTGACWARLASGRKGRGVGADWRCRVELGFTIGKGSTGGTKKMPKNCKPIGGQS